MLAAVDVGSSVQTGLDSFFGFLPKLLGFIIVLAIGWIVAKVVKGLVTKLLQKVGIDRALHSGSTGSYVNKVAPDLKPSSTIGSLAYWFIFLGAVAIAMTSTGTTEPTTLPVGVSPIVRATSPPTAAATAPAITKISTAAMMFGM